MTRRLLAIAFIYICTAAAWLVLGATIFQRTSASDGHLRSRVGSTWGTRHTQQAPAAFIERLEPVRTQATRPRPDGTETVTEPSGLVAAPAPGTHATLERTRVPLSLERTRASVAFDLDHRQKGLLWYSTYQVDFEGAYRFRNVTNSDFADIDFPENALSPRERRRRGTGGRCDGATRTCSQASRSAWRCPRSSSPAPSRARSPCSRRSRCSSSSP